MSIFQISLENWPTFEGIHHVKQGCMRFRCISPPCKRDEYRLRNMLVNSRRIITETLTKVFIDRISDTEELCGKLSSLQSLHIYLLSCPHSLHGGA